MVHGLKEKRFSGNHFTTKGPIVCHLLFIGPKVCDWCPGNLRILTSLPFGPVIEGLEVEVVLWAVTPLLLPAKDMKTINLLSTPKRERESFGGVDRRFED